MKQSILFAATSVFIICCGGEDETVTPTITDAAVEVDTTAGNDGLAELTKDLTPDAITQDTPMEIEADVPADVSEVAEIASGCKDHAECNTKNPCMEDWCDIFTGTCEHKVHPKNACSDEDACTKDDACDPKSGQCIGKPIASCEDNNICTTDACDKKKGCVFTHTIDPCNDNSACTKDDVCSLGVCAGVAIICDDKDTCTQNSCSTKTGCFFEKQNNIPCDDNSVCTNADVCLSGVCKGSAVNCGDGNPCTVDACDKTAGCFSTAATTGSKCSDADECTLGDQCADSVCKSGNKKVCNDNSVCTADTCNSSTGGCLFDPLPGIFFCDDNNACTDTDSCKLGMCIGKLVQCNDGKPCTTDSCIKETGCQYFVQDKAPCTDENACTLGDLCVKDQCKGTIKTCEDNVECTIDTCDPALGNCNHTANEGYYCNDGNACTTNDICKGFKCLGKTLACNDNNSCTDDNCNPQTGCFSIPTPNAPCDDGNLCTKDDFCNKSLCIAKPVVCDDGNSCTKDACNKANGSCTYEQVKDGIGCNDDNACTTADACKSGVCTGQVDLCDDTNPCTADVCDPKSGKCTHTGIPGCS